MKLIILSLLFKFFVTFNVFANEVTISLKELQNNSNGKIVFMRHALAPGYGDPANFNISECETQRNLDATGIEQSKLIGATFKKNKIKFTKIFSSFWCRCKDTAKFLNMGSFKVHKGLNSFFQGHVDRNETLEQLKKLVNSLSSSNGPYLMVTHYVVIQSFTGISVPSGGMAVYDLNTKKVYNLDMKN